MSTPRDLSDELRCLSEGCDQPDDAALLNHAADVLDAMVSAARALDSGQIAATVRAMPTDASYRCESYAILLGVLRAEFARALALYAAPIPSCTPLDADGREATP